MAAHNGNAAERYQRVSTATAKGLWWRSGNLGRQPAYVERVSRRGKYCRLRLTYRCDLSEEGLIYHYPETRRPPGRDRSEIDATKAAAELKLPIFVILSEPSDPTLRRVRLGWVADWDDASKQFLVLFGDERPTYQHSALADQPFQLHRPRERKVVQSLARVGQQKFRFQVLKQYGAKCCVCSIAMSELLAAAHICGKEPNGSDDWRNGIPLCHTHHAAFDLGLFFIDPDTLKVEIREGLNPSQLCLTEPTLQPIRGRPHLEALRWRYGSKRDEDRA